MKFDSPNSTAASGLAIFRWATSATLALILASLLGSAVALLLIYSFGYVEVLRPYMPSLAEILFTLGTTGTPLVLSYLYFTGRTPFVTGWSQKLHPFFHLDSNLPNFPKVLGFNYRLVGMTFKKIALWVIAGFALTYLFDYATDAFIHIGPSGTEAAVSSNVGAPSGPQGIEQVLAHMTMTNFLITSVLVALLAAFMEEMVFRGVIFNLWRTSFASQAEDLSNSPSTFGRAVHKFLSVCGSSIAVIIAAALFALAHLNIDAFLSEFFFGLVAGALYLVTRTIWTPVLLHVVTNSVLPIVILASSIGGSMTGTGSGNTSDPAVKTTEPAHNHAVPLSPAASPETAPTTSSTTSPVTSTAESPNLGIRVPGMREVIEPGDGQKRVRPLVAQISQEDLNRADFNASGNGLVQVCKAEECASQLAILETLAKQYPDVEFSQANSANNAEFVARLEIEQAGMAKAKGSNVSASIVYPVYVYANQGLQIAPTGTSSEADVKKFVELNYTVYGESNEDNDDLMDQYVSKACNPENQGQFDGKALYGCAFDLVATTDLSIIDPEKRAAFVEKWQHKFDRSNVLLTEEGTAKAIRSMLADLNEMHTNFFTAQQAKDLEQMFDSNSAGIGLRLTRLNLKAANQSSTVQAHNLMGSDESLALSKITDDTPLVVYPDPIEGSPAAAAGLKKGDRIVEVGNPVINTVASSADTKPSNGRTVNDVVTDIRGSIGTSVVLKVLRPKGSDFEKLTFTVVRAKIHSKVATWKRLDNGYAAVKVELFGDNVSKEFSEALYSACTDKTLPEGKSALAAIVNNYQPEKDCSQLKGLAIDLRNNPGGRLDQVVEMMQAIMKDGIIVSTLNREGNEIIEVKESVTAGQFRREKVVNGKPVKSYTHPRFWRILPENLPIVVLINEGSASASELMSSALQKNGIATVVGAPSFGKEVGQSVNRLDFGTKLKITTFRFLPAGSDLGVAVLPDFEVGQDTAFVNDPLNAPDLMMLKAQEVLAKGKDALVEAKSAEVLARKAAAATAAAELHKMRENQALANQKSGNLIEE